MIVVYFLRYDKDLTMAMRKLLLIVFLATYSGLASAAEFFEVGNTYIFVPRVNMVMKGKVVKITGQEIVFINRYILKESIPGVNISDDHKSGVIKSQAIVNYMKSTNKASLLEASALKDVPISYSRGALTAIKVDE